MAEPTDQNTEIARLRAEIADLEGRLAERDIESGLGLLFDDMFEGIQVIDRDFRYLYLNRTAAEHARRDRDDLVGRRMDEAFPGIEHTGIYAIIGRCMTDRQGTRLLNRFEYPDGSAGWFDLHVSPVEPGVLVLSIDVSREQAVTEELRRNRARLAATLDCMVDAVVTTDRAGAVTGLNPAAVAMLGVATDTAYGQPLSGLVAIHRRGGGEPVADPIRAALADGGSTFRLEDIDLVDGEGARRPVLGSGAPLRSEGGEVEGVVLVFKDMSDEVDLAARLEQSQRLESIGRLAGGIAHDFNNLLTVIQGYCNMALEEEPDAEVQEGLVEINRAAVRAGGLTHQLLAFSRRQVLQPEVLDLNAVVADMDRMLRRTIGEDIDLVTRLHDPLDRVEADPGQLEQVVMNLAINARDAMPSGGKLTIETANAELDDAYARSHAEAQAGPHVMLAVSDTGTGMPPEVREKIFEPFYTTKDRGKGTGLGLATVYGIVKQSGGNIWVYSEPGFGSTFKIYLPATVTEAHQRRQPIEEITSLHGSETLLVVEDEQSVRRLIRRILERAGYEVLTAAGAEEAFEHCEARGGDISLLLTDVVLPGLGGRPMAERIAAAWPHVRVVYMSGYTDNAIVHRGVLDKGTAFIAKPVRPEELLRRLRGYLDAPPGAADA